MDEQFSYIEDSFRSTYPFHHYGFVLGRTFGTALAAILTNLLLFYLFSFIRWLFKKYLVLEDMIYWVDMAVFMVNLFITAAVALVLDRRFKRYWAREVLLKFAAEEQMSDASQQL